MTGHSSSPTTPTMADHSRVSYDEHIKRRHHERGWLYACVFTVCCCFCCHEACEGCLKVFCCCGDSDKKEEKRERREEKKEEKRN